MKNLVVQLWLVGCLTLGFAPTGEAKVKLAHLFSDGMVLQHGEPIRVWGWADPQERVTISIQGLRAETVADANGRWATTLAPLTPGGPYEMTVNNNVVRDILVGDVWLCSGQSNMETTIERVRERFEEEIRSYENPMIRYIKTPTSSHFYEQADIPQARWLPVAQEHIESFSALAYFFAKAMYARTGIPVGIVNSSVGGSPIEAWIAAEWLQPFPRIYNDWSMGTHPEFREASDAFNRISGQIWRETLYREDPGLHAVPRWYDAGLDDSDWTTVDAFDRSWSMENGQTLAGSFWFRQEIDLPAHLAGRSALLRVGTLVDADSVFVNGTFVGTTGYQYPPRKYPVPEGLLCAGKNTVTVRIIAPGGNAQFIPDKPYQLIVGEEEIPLKSAWRMRRGATLPPQAGAMGFSQKPSTLYNGMIAPIRDFAVKGVIWYQGESNTGRTEEYDALLQTLIRNWRADRQRNDLPFLVVQLPNFMSPAPQPSDGGWARMREVQRRVSQEMPDVGLVVAIDAGEWNDIHPLDKKTIGQRLALQARRLVYGEAIVADGPVFDSLRRAGNRLILSFRAGTDDLRPVAELKGFAVSGKDGRYHWADASIEGDRVVVRSDRVDEPVSVRYAWADNPAGANLYNTAGLPASPFQAAISGE